MSSSPSYSPNVSDNTIIQEETWFLGMLLSNFFFGIEATICVLAFLAVSRKRSVNHGRVRIALLVYIAILFSLGTTVQGLTIDWVQMGFINQRNYPGGPSAFLLDEWWIPVSAASNILSVLANWMMESLLVWRCRVVCSAGRRLWWFGVAVPLLLLMGVVVTGSLFIYENSNASLKDSTIIAYSTCSLAVNLTATGFIAGRLLVYRYRVVSRIGREHGQQYVSVAAVIVESAAVYTCFLLLIIVTYATGSPATNLMQLVILQVQSITSLLIIWRIARGEGWTRSTHTDVLSTGVTSSLNTRVGPGSQQNVIQLEVVSVRPDEASSMGRKEVDRKVSFPKDPEV